MQNAEIIKELQLVLAEMDYFAIHPSTNLHIWLADATTDGDRIRMILRDQDVQEYLFPDWTRFKESVQNPIEHYIHLRKQGIIAPR